MPRPPKPTKSFYDDEVHQTKLKRLNETIVNLKAPPYYSNVVPLDDIPDATVVFYGKKLAGAPTPVGGLIDFANASDEELAHFIGLCEKATFGRNEKDVLDLSYRTALKLDEDKFAPKLDIARTGILDAIRYNLLDPGKDDTVRAELHKLNVYEKGAFFKAHKDTPRSYSMFGSLVVVFPTPHEGGQLVLRHGGEEFTFDSAEILRESPNRSPVAFIALYSDVEHEVLPVTSGHRISITYNLYYDGDIPVPWSSKVLQDTPTNTFYKALRELLDDPSFFPKGGILGFGFSHEYPISRSKKGPVFAGMEKGLKGLDAVVLKTAKALNLPVSINAFYDDQESDPSVQVLCPDFVDFGDAVIGRDTSYEKWEVMVEKCEGKVVSKSDPRLADEVDYPVHWVTEVTTFNNQTTKFTAYGNEPYSDCIYGSLCLVVEVGPPGGR